MKGRNEGMSGQIPEHLRTRKSGRVRWRRAFLCVSGFVFAATLAIALRTFTHDSMTAWRFRTTEYRNRIPDTSDAEAIFWGSSRFREGIDAKVFEAASGLRTENMGLNGLLFQEMPGLIRPILERSPRLKVLFIELQAPWPWPYADGTSVQLASHDIFGAAMSIESVFAEDGIPHLSRIEFAACHMKASIRRYGLFGTAGIPYQGPRNRQDGGSSSEAWRWEGREIIRQLASGEMTRRYEKSNLASAAYLRIIEECRSADVEPVFVILPRTVKNDLASMDVLMSYAHGCAVIDLAGPEKNADLYDASLWIDPMHIGGDASALISRRIYDSYSRPPEAS